MCINTVLCCQRSHLLSTGLGRLSKGISTTKAIQTPFTPTLNIDKPFFASTFSDLSTLANSPTSHPRLRRRL